MERKEYLDRCQKQAALKNQTVCYQGVNYAPLAYQLSFCPDGKVRHTAVIHDLKSNTVINCRLEDIK